MCGITGQFDTRGKADIDRAVLQRMNDSQLHRGPDEGSLHLEPGLGDGLAALQRGHGLPEQRVVVLLRDTVDFPIAFWGCLRAGVVPVPINTLLTADMVGYILADSRAAGVVVTEGLVEGLGGVLEAASVK